MNLIPIILIGFTMMSVANTTVASRQDQPSYATIDEYVQRQMKQNHIPGVALAITQGDRIVHLRGFGVSSPSGEPVTPQTPMMIGSVSKSFTALAIMQMADAGQIDLEAPVQKYIPWFRLSDPSASAQVTIRNLLNHTSGISRASGEQMLAEEDISTDALECQVRALGNVHPNRPVGSGFEYSNANYVILGMVIQAVSGKTYETYVRESIFSPLDMKNSFTTQAEAETHGLSAGYRQWFGFPVPSGNLPRAGGLVSASGLISTAEDLAHYSVAQLNHGQYQDMAVLSSQGMEVLHRSTIPATPEGYHRQPSGYYAAGWYVMNIDGKQVIGHDGDVPNFHADVLLVPSEKWGLVLLVNTNTVLMGEGIRDMATDILSLLTGHRLSSRAINAGSMLLYISMIAVLFFELGKALSLIRDVVRLSPSSPIQHSSWFRRFILPLIIGLTIGLWMLMGLPGMFGVPLKVMMLYQPDLSWVIAVAGTLAIANGVSRVGLNLLRGEYLRSLERVSGTKEEI